MKSLAVAMIVALAVATGILEVKRRPDVYEPFIPDWAESLGTAR